MNQPKERPVLFKGEMVNAILDGRKTQTRRAIKNNQPTTDQLEIRKYRPGTYAITGLWSVQSTRLNNLGKTFGKPFKCPYGKPGDRLWVRESHAFSVIDPDGLDWRDDPENWDVVYRADDDGLGLSWRNGDGEVITPPWRPSIHMPRWASRILLEITDVRVERLQDISYSDAQAEGMYGDYSRPPITENPWLGNKYGVSTIDRYRELWQSINGPGSWDANPWVWVIEFKRLESSQ